MSRQDHSRWFLGYKRRRATDGRCWTINHSRDSRRLCVEALEDRRMLAIPSVVSVTPNIITVADVNVGVGAFALTITYSEAMNIVGPAPTITFSPFVGSTLIFDAASSFWLNDTTYQAVYGVSDVGVTQTGVAVTVEGAESASTMDLQLASDIPDAFSIDTENARVTSIVRLDANPTNAASVDFAVTFDEVVTGVDVSDFGLTSTVAGATVTSVSGSGAFYTVSVATGTGNGTINLDLATVPSIVDSGGNALANTGVVGADETYTLDRQNPRVTSLVRLDGNPTDASSVDFAVTFDEAVTGVDVSDFGLTSTVAGAAITAVSGSGAFYTVSVATGTGNGTINLDLAAVPSIVDSAGNALLNTAVVGADETYTINRASEYIVDTTDDISNGNFSVGDLSLREAIELANADPSFDTITFHPTLSGQTISLNGSELEVTTAMAVDATGLAQRVIVDAKQQSRLVRIYGQNTTSDDFDVRLAGLELINGRTVGDNTLTMDLFGGGGIRAEHSGLLVIEDSILKHNRTEGQFADGGAVRAVSEVRIIDSVVSENSTMFGSGGGINMRTPLQDLTLIRSVVSQNTAHTGSGGGIVSSQVTLLQSTVSDNTAAESGGGIVSNGSVSLFQSTVSGNEAGAVGGGVSAREITLNQSTVTANHADGRGGGLFVDSSPVLTPFEMFGSILAGNTGGASGNAFPDLRFNDAGLLDVSVDYSLIGNTNGSGISAATGVGNVLDQSPLLGPLADNGGPTQTHALLPGSPAIDAGDPTIQHNPSEFDQRGPGFLRVADGDMLTVIVIDMGAYEAQGPPSADFDSDGDTDGHDFLRWQRGFGKLDAVRADGNSDDDTDVDASDLEAWRVSYGQVVGSGQTVVGSEQLVDLAMALEWLAAEQDGSESLVSDAAKLPTVTYDLEGQRLASRADVVSEHNEPVVDADDDDGSDQPWLAEELLERVFG